MSLRSSCRTASRCLCQGGLSQTRFRRGSLSQHLDMSKHLAMMQCQSMSLCLAANNKSLSHRRHRSLPSPHRHQSPLNRPCLPILSPPSHQALSLWPRPNGSSLHLHTLTRMTSGTSTCHGLPGLTSVTHSGATASLPLHQAGEQDGLTSTGGK